jgi:hypothetical protein
MSTRRVKGRGEVFGMCGVLERASSQKIRRENRIWEIMVRRTEFVK